MPDYRVRVRSELAGGLDQVTVQGQVPDDTAPFWLLDGLKLRWETDGGVGGALQPQTASFEVFGVAAGDQPPALTVGDPLTIRIDHGDLVPDTADALVAHFRGRVTDATAEPAIVAGRRGLLYRFTAVDRLVDLTDEDTETNLPQEGQEERLSRLLAEMGWTVTDPWWNEAGAFRARVLDNPTKVSDLVARALDVSAGAVNDSMSRKVTWDAAIQTGGVKAGWRRNYLVPMLAPASQALLAAVFERHGRQGVFRMAPGAGQVILDPAANAEALGLSAAWVDMGVQWTRTKRQAHNRVRIYASKDGPGFALGTIPETYVKSVRVDDVEDQAVHGAITMRVDDSEVTSRDIATDTALMLLGDAAARAAGWAPDGFTTDTDLLPARGVQLLRGSALWPSPYPEHYGRYGLGGALGRTVVIDGVDTRYKPFTDSVVSGRLIGVELRIERGVIALACAITGRGAPLGWRPQDAPTTDDPISLDPAVWTALGNPRLSALPPNMRLADFRLVRNTAT